MNMIAERGSLIVPVQEQLGENEMQALEDGACCVLPREEAAKIYVER